MATLDHLVCGVTRESAATNPLQGAVPVNLALTDHQAVPAVLDFRDLRVIPDYLECRDATAQRACRE